MPGLVLIVEDDTDLLLLYRRAFRQAGLRIRQVSSANAALEEIGKETPDILITDIGMADMSGTELIRRVRANPDCKAVKIIVITAYTSLIAEAKVAGAEYCLAKPIHMDPLIDLVRKLLS